ncbi:MAG: ABC transporter substrate-binding protein [Chloroflexota bacterium]|nr:ABC transporter substrate-binding protein [Dehalococcoidia bacterium]MDW8254946.1 ABC transporter substrate-binding protein [Chloroflexota bacterium]
MLRSRVAAVLALVVLVAGCAPNPAASPTGGRAPAPPQPQRFVWGFSFLQPTLHPFISIGMEGRRFDIFEQLLTQDPTGRDVQPMLASAWKVIDPQTYEFTLRGDGRFHDGTPLTAIDVAFSVNRAIDPEKRYPIGASRFPTLEGAEAIDDKTVRVRTKSVDVLLLKRMAYLSILPKGYLERVGDDEFTLRPVGSGPFKVKEFFPGDRLVLVPHTEHPWRKSKFSEVIIKNVPEASARVAGLRSGELHYISATPIDQVDALKAAGFQAVQLDAGSSGGYRMTAIYYEPLRDKRVRQAINYAIDKEAIVKSIYRGYTQVEQGQFLQPGVFGYHPTLKPYPYDPALARRLLAEAGYPNGFDLKLEAKVDRADIAQVGLFVQDQLRAIGIRASFDQIVDQATVEDKIFGRVQRAPLWASGLITTPFMDADAALVWFWSGQPPATRYYENPEFDRYFLQSRTETDPKKREELIWKALEVLHEDPPYLFLVQTTEIHMYTPTLQGVVKRFDRAPLLDTLSFRS